MIYFYPNLTLNESGNNKRIKNIKKFKNKPKSHQFVNVQKLMEIRRKINRLGNKIKFIRNVVQKI